MPAVKKKNPTPCDDWENQDYDDPIPDSPPSTNPTDDRIPSTRSPSLNQDPPASSNLASEASLDPIESENFALWNDANRNPTYVVLPANASHSAVTENQPLVQETMFGKSKVIILKRPKATNEATRNSNTSSSSSSGVISVSMREKAYLQARERIFGSSASSCSDDLPSNKSVNSNSAQIASDPFQNSLVAIERQPIGPVALDQKGFANRQKSVST